MQAVVTNRGEIAAGAVLNATAGWATTISRMAGVPLPIVTPSAAGLRHRTAQAVSWTR